MGGDPETQASEKGVQTLIKHPSTEGGRSVRHPKKASEKRVQTGVEATQYTKCRTGVQTGPRGHPETFFAEKAVQVGVGGHTQVSRTYVQTVV